MHVILQLINHLRDQLLLFLLQKKAGKEEQLLKLVNNISTWRIFIIKITRVSYNLQIVHKVVVILAIRSEFVRGFVVVTFVNFSCIIMYPHLKSSSIELAENGKLLMVNTDWMISKLYWNHLKIEIFWFILKVLKLCYCLNLSLSKFIFQIIQAIDIYCPLIDAIVFLFLLFFCDQGGIYW